MTSSFPLETGITQPSHYRGRFLASGFCGIGLVSVAFLVIQNGQGVLLSSGSVMPRLCGLSWKPCPPNWQIEAVGPGSNNFPSVYTRFKRGKEPSLLPPVVARNRADSVYSPCPAGMNSSLPGCLPPGSTGNAGPMHGLCVCVCVCVSVCVCVCVSVCVWWWLRLF